MLPRATGFCPPSIHLDTVPFTPKAPMSQSKRVIFLDVDGVLHPFPLDFATAQGSDTTECLQASCMQQLQRIILSTGACIVLSSSWRFFPSTRQRLQDSLASYGIPPFQQWIAADAERDVKDRMDLIMEFVEGNPETVSGGWVVIDDADLAAGHDSLIAEVFKQHYVKTNPMVGLTKELADKAIAVLQQDDDECSESSSMEYPC
ncbi:hypothetical protein FOZ61_003392 [Perkinsus olseni]|uniref:Uncharacterized protein n=2 Tax=Perkinsus olseni TaxID=32597 RepID=A0A7J6LQ81_PEROL|nr:hypothetical protein FOZ61_003392 [Perkinsus olseni]